MGGSCGSGLVSVEEGAGAQQEGEYPGKRFMAVIGIYWSLNIRRAGDDVKSK
jgi:hypothetical protein